ncbi:MAG: diguanylate cyclase [Microthrixaceae bacterium]
MSPLPRVPAKAPALDGLPSMPAAAARIVQLCDDPNLEVAQLSQAVSLDPVLSARILRLANSAAYNKGHSVTSVDRAMMMMGVKLVKITALGFVVGSTVWDRLDDHEAAADQVWRQCLVEAVACRELSQRANLRSTPEAFLCGLFDGMGQLLGLLVEPEEFSALLASTPWPSDGALRKCLGTTTSALVQQALRSWGVPDLYSRVLESADQAGDENSPGLATFDFSEVGRLSAVLLLARHATRELLGEPLRSTRGLAQARSLLALDSADVSALAVDLGGHVRDLAKSLGVDLQGKVDYQELLTKSRQKMIEASMEVAEDSLAQSDRITSLETTSEAYRLESVTDRLTGLTNRAGLDQRFPEVIRERIEGRTVSGGLAVAMIDIDHFKHLNDTYGHPAGDQMLAAVGAMLGTGTRAGEFCARYGGEEFLLVMPMVDNRETLERAVERFRRELAALRVEVDGHVLQVTVSIGAVAATRVDGIDTGVRMVEAADRLLYAAKSSGRDRCCVQFVDGDFVGI